LSSGRSSGSTPSTAPQARLLRKLKKGVADLKGQREALGAEVKELAALRERVAALEQQARTAVQELRALRALHERLAALAARFAAAPPSLARRLAPLYPPHAAARGAALSL
jgi:predicted  nucleic acid-binding Zn-ribbon protein